MNKVHLAGYLTKDPQIEYHGQNNFASAKFTIACSRPFKNKDGKYDADFIMCSAVNKTAEMIEKYFHKGSYIVVSDAWWKTGNYTNKDGQKVYFNECQVNSIEFGNKAEGGSANNTATQPQTQKDEQPTAQQPQTNTEDEFMEIPDGIEDELPFFG